MSISFFETPVLLSQSANLFQNDSGTDRSTPEQSLRQLLDSIYAALSASEPGEGQVESAVDQLFRELLAIQQTTPRDEWYELIRIGRAHPLCALVHQDPFTARAFYKPRGYAGDAVMMDYIYGREEERERPVATNIGSAIFEYTTGAPASAGVRERRYYIAELLDQVAKGNPRPHVLSVAAGHLREASLSLAVRRKRFSRFLALDTDKQSLSEIYKSYGRFGIEPIAADARRMLTGKLDIGTFDLIYTTGLYDYLANSTAKRLTANLFNLVRPGGRLVIANFLPAVHDIGYMEMYMDWHLIYRSRSQMLMLADQIVQSRIAEAHVSAETNENVVIMELIKR
jgi:extracellular factor (EF) 3-hydroxypalmitic acid methyl ester biosynthesis protein